MSNARDDHDLDILLVEDNPGDARLATEALKECRRGNRVHWAADGRQALSFLLDGERAGAAHRPDLVLLDLNLPGMNGREFLAEMRRHPSLNRIPVVVLSASDSEENRAACADLYANCFVAKPTDWLGFREVMRSIERLWLAFSGAGSAAGADTDALEPPAAAPQEAVPSGLPGGPLRILLIEDSPGDARLVRELLHDTRREGVLLAHAPGMTEGLRLLSENRFDAVLLDLFLPDSQGLATLMQVRGAAPEAPAIVLTGLQDEALAALALRQGAQDYLVKGRFDGQTLLRAVGNAIERTRSRMHLQHMVHHDPLTGLPNRVLLEDRLRKALEHAMRHAQNVAVLYLDLDRFKEINDRHGHAAGDRLMQAVAGRLSACVRASDTVARVGGDEFTILLPEITRLEDVTTVCDKILTELRLPFHLGEARVGVTASIGASLFPGDGEDVETLVRHADAAMYQAKDGGRDGYRLVAPPGRDGADRPARLRAAEQRRRRPPQTP